MIALKYIFEQFDIIKETGSTNKKQEYLEMLLKVAPEVKEIFDIIYDVNTRFNLSSRSFEKIVYYDGKESYEDAGDLVSKYPGRDLATFDYLTKFLDAAQKLKGNDLLDFIKDNLLILEPIYSKWFTRILVKDLKLGLSTKSINKVLKKLGMPLVEIFEVQLAQKIDDINEWDTFPCFVSTKYDGFRAIVQKIGDEVTITSRQGKDVTFVPELIEFFKKNPRDFILDGEIMAKDFNAIQKRIGRKSENIEEVEGLHFRVFDILSYKGTDVSKLFQKERTELIRLYFDPNELFKFEEIWKVDDKETLLEIYKNHCDREEEGIMIKYLDRPYDYGSRKNWIKVKPVFEATFKVVGFEYGSGKYKDTVGALLIEDKFGLVKSKVGSGLNDDLREKFLDMVKHEELNGLLVEIIYNEITTNAKDEKSLRFPRLNKIRTDLNEADDLSEK